VDFSFYPLRFEFVARERVEFPAGKAANTLRGALGLIFQSNGCERLFEPRAGGPSGLADPPRPFVFRARHLDGCVLEAGERFHFGVNLFSMEPETVGYFVRAFDALGREGVGPGRGKAELLSTSGAPVTLSLEPSTIGAGKVRVEFLSPTELKHGGNVVEQPEFSILFGRIRDRVSGLRSLYGGGAIEMDYRASGVRAANIRMTRCEMRREETRRRSTRTGQSHSLGGFVGVAEYEGDLTEFLPWLEAAKFAGVGRQAVWGKGEIAVSSSWEMCSRGFTPSTSVYDCADLSRPRR
jgi:hypothetical protein